LNQKKKVVQFFPFSFSRENEECGGRVTQKKRGERTTVSVQRSKILINNEKKKKSLKQIKKNHENWKKKETKFLSLSNSSAVSQLQKSLSVCIFF